MNRGMLVTLLVLILVGCASTGGSSRTADLSGKTRLKSMLESKFENSGEDFDEKDRIADVDEPRALRCVVEAMMADMSDAQANRLADMLERRIAPEKEFVLYWVNPRDSGHPERAKQVRDRAYQICPDLAPAMMS
jgi:hypothetical protein